jgi:hypothetical protein
MCPPLVLGEFTCLTEPLSATWVVTGIGLHARMNVVVVLQVLGQGEFPEANFALKLAIRIMSGLVAPHAVLGAIDT